MFSRLATQSRFSAHAAGLSSLSAPSTTPSDYEVVSRLTTTAMYLAHSSAAQSGAKEMTLDSLVTTIRALHAASNNPSAYRHELGKLVPLLSRGGEFHDSFEDTQRGLRAFITNQGDWGGVATSLEALERYRHAVESAMLSMSDGGPKQSIYQLLREVGGALGRVRQEVGLGSRQSGVWRSISGLLRGATRGESMGAMQKVVAKAALDKREDWFSEFDTIVNGVHSKARQGSTETLVSLKDALRWGVLCSRIGNSCMDAPTPGFDQEGWSGLWSRFRRACGPLFAVLPSCLKPSGDGEPLEEVVIASASALKQSPVIAPLSLEATGSGSFVSRCEDILRRHLTTGAAREVSYALQKSFLWDRTSPNDKVALVEQVVAWHRRNLDRYGSGEIDDGTGQALRFLAERMLEEDVGMYASPREVGLVRAVLDGPALTFQKRQNLLHTLATIYARSLFRTTVPLLTERFLARVLQEPVYDEVAGHNLPAINGRLSALAQSLDAVYPGISLVARWGMDGDVAISLFQQGIGEIFESNHTRANPVFFREGENSRETVLYRAIHRVLSGLSTDPLPFSFSIELADQDSVEGSHDAPLSKELTPQESALLDRLLAPGESKDGEETPQSTSDISQKRSVGYSGRMIQLVTPSVRSDGISLFRCEDATLGLTYQNRRWVIKEEAQDVGVPRIAEAPDRLVVSRAEWASVETAISQFHAERTTSHTSLGGLRGGVVALHLESLAGADVFRNHRIERMARAAAHLDPCTVVVALGTVGAYERFARAFDRAERFDAAKPLLFSSMDNIAWVGGEDRVMQVLTRSEAALHPTIHESVRIVLEDPILGEESGAAIYAPWLFVAQAQAQTSGAPDKSLLVLGKQAKY